MKKKQDITCECMFVKEGQTMCLDVIILICTVILLDSVAWSLLHVNVLIK